MSEDLSGFSLLDLFRSEVASQVAAMSEGLLAVEADAQDRAALEAVMRAAHSIKGAARVVDIPLAVRLSHEMESVLVAAQEGAIRLDRPAFDALLRASDLLTAIAALPDAALSAGEGPTDDVERAVAGFAALLAAETSAAPATPAPSPPPPGPAPERPPPTSVVVAVPSPAPVGVTPHRDRSVRVSADNLARLIGMTGEALVEARRLPPLSDGLRGLARQQTRLADVLDLLQAQVRDTPASPALEEARLLAQEGRQTLAKALDDLEEYCRRGDALTSRLHEQVLSSRMRPFEDGIQGFPRLVRDLANQLGKEVTLAVLGRNVGVDRDVLDKLEAPLTHLLQNSLDHGLETPEERRAAGKPERGTLRLEARHRAGLLVIVVADDGRGIDPERVRRRVVERGLAAPDLAAGLSDAELFEFLFLPGFSTTDRVTSVSGRGVGLDVVQRTLQEIGGTIEVVSEPGRGLTFQLQLPITLSVMRAVLVEIAGETCAFPLNRIDRIQTLPVDEVRTIEGRPYYLFDGRTIALVPARELLDLEGADPVGADLCVVVVSDRVTPIGLIVDRFKGEHDLVVRPLDPRLGKIPDVAAASIDKDGDPMLILDVDDLVRSVVKFSARGGGLGLRALRPERRAAARRILLVEDSITVRELQRQILVNLGYLVDVAVDGVDGWNSVRANPYDLVVTDVDMPRMNGIDLVRNVRQHPRLRTLPVIIVSYKERIEDRMKGLDAGANAYLTKSRFQDAALRQAVEDLIGPASEAR